MRAVIQRVTRAAVHIDGETVASIGKGMLVLLGVGKGDTESDVEFLADKIVNLRIFEDEQGKMNLSARQIGCELLVVSQFTLYGDCSKGRRPSFDQAATPETARAFYERFVEQLRQSSFPVKTGNFQAHMYVELINDGPVTFVLEK